MSPRPDPLAALFIRTHVTAHVFHTGALRGVAPISSNDGRGHLHLLREGKATLRRGEGSEIVLGPPAAILIARPLDHVLATDGEGSADIVCADLDFGPGGVHLRRSLPDVLVLPLEPVDVASGALGLLFEEAARDECGRQAMLDRLAEVALIAVLRHALRRRDVGEGLLAGLAHPALGRALARIHEMPYAPWTVETMAEEAGMSRTSFAEAFRSVVGTTPARYVQMWRLDLARAELASGRSLKQVARAVGYASHSALSRALSSRE